MTNLEQVKNLLSITGTNSNASITDWLIAGGRVIADLMPIDKLNQFATSEVVGVTALEIAATPSTLKIDEVPGGVSLVNKKFLSINSTNGGIFIPTSVETFRRSLIVLPGSIYKVIPNGSQYYTIDGTLLKVTSGSNSLKTYTYPTVTSENVTNLPNEYIHGAVLYAASNTITNLIKALVFTIAEADKVTFDVTAFNTAKNLIAITNISPLLSDLDVTITELNNYFATLDGTALTPSGTGLGYINTLEDIELAQSKMNEMQIKLKEIETELGLKLQEQLKNIEQKNDVEKVNQAQKLQAAIQTVDAIIKKYSADLQKYQVDFSVGVQNADSEKQKLMGLQKMLLEQFNQFIMLMFPRQQPAPQQ